MYDLYDIVDGFLFLLRSRRNVHRPNADLFDSLVLEVVLAWCEHCKHTFNSRFCFKIQLLNFEFDSVVHYCTASSHV